MGVGAASDAAGHGLGGFVSGVASGIKGMFDFGKTAISLGSALLEPDASMEQMQIGFKNLFGSMSAAKDMLQQLTFFAAKTPFQEMDIDAAAAKLKAMGEAGKSIIPDLTAIGDTLSALGQTTPAKLEQVVAIFGKIDTTGKLTTGIMTQLSRNGINAWQALAEATGKPIPALQEMVHKGLIPAQVGIQDLRTGLEKLYGGGMAAQAQTFNGLVSTLKDNFLAAWRAISGPIFEQAKAGVSDLLKVISSQGFQDFATKTGKAIGDAFANIGNTLKGISFQPILDMFQDLGHFLKGLDVGELMGSFNQVGSAISKLLGPVSSLKVSMPGPDFWNSVDVAIKGLVTGGVSTLTTIFQGLADTIKFLTPTIQEVAGIIGGVFADHIKTASGIVQDLSKWFSSTLVPAVQQAMPSFQALAQVLIQDVVPAIVKIWAAGQQFEDTVAKAIVPVIEKALPFFIQLGGVISGGLAAALKFLMPYIVQAAQAIGQFAGEIATRVAPIIENWFDMMSKGLNAFLQIWNAVWPYLAPILQGVWDEIVGVIKIAWALVSGIIKIGLDLLSGNWSQAWEDFKSMLSGVWDGIKQVLKGAWEIIAGWATGAWNLIASAISAPIKAVGNWLAGAWDTFKNDAAIAWHNITSTISGIVTGITTWLANAWHNAVSTVVGWFNWLYDHNYYFKALVDTIRSVIGAVVTWLTTTWANITGWISHEWAYLTTLAEIKWAMVQFIIQSKIRQVEQFVHNVLSAIGNFFSSQWNTLVSNTQTLWNRISGVFSGAWSKYIAGPLGGLGNSIGGFFSDLASKAFNWGKSLIQGIIDGINNMVGAVGDAANKVADKIAGILGFHHSTFTPPREGPASRADHWMPDFVQGITEGIMQGMPMLQNAMSRFAGTLTLSPGASPGLSDASHYAFPSIAGASSGGGSKQPVHIHVDVGSKELASVLYEDVMDLAARHVRIKHGRKVF